MAPGIPQPRQACSTHQYLEGFRLPIFLLLFAVVQGSASAERSGASRDTRLQPFLPEFTD
jgi:hypothetical protein